MTFWEFGQPDDCFGVIRVAPTGSKASPNVRYAFNGDRICASQRTDAMCQQRTSKQVRAMSALSESTEKWTWPDVAEVPFSTKLNSKLLFDDFVCTSKQRGRHFEAKRPSCVNIYHELEFGGLHDR